MSCRVSSLDLDGTIALTESDRHCYIGASTVDSPPCGISCQKRPQRIPKLPSYKKVKPAVYHSPCIAPRPDHPV